ncbi:MULTISPECIES: transposase [Streptomyces]|nr:MULTISPECIES: transposase [Streptomyces]
MGPDSAAALLITAGDNPERLGSEASFAALCGVSPVEKSSGKSTTPSAQSRRRQAGQRRTAPHRGHAHETRRAYPPLP